MTTWLLVQCVGTPLVAGKTSYELHGSLNYQTLINKVKKGNTIVIRSKSVGNPGASLYSSSHSSLPYRFEAGLFSFYCFVCGIQRSNYRLRGGAGICTLKKEMKSSNTLIPPYPVWVLTAAASQNFQKLCRCREEE